MTQFNTVAVPSLQILAPQFSQAMTSRPFFSFRDLPRKDAIEEGYLIDVSTLSTSFKADVCITREVWELYISIDDPELFNRQCRVVSLLAQAKMAIKHAVPHTAEVFFEVKRFPRRSQSFLNKIRLWIVVSSGDSNEPVLTVMLDTQHGEALND